MLLLITFLSALASTPALALTPADARQCLGPFPYAADMSRLGALKSTLGSVAWEDACRQARQADERRRSLISKLMISGRSPLGGYDGTEGIVQMKMAEKDPTRAALYFYVAQDQAARESLTPKAKEVFAHGLSNNALVLLNARISGDAVKADGESRRWLSHTFARRGWFTLSRDGEDADSAAWLIVQHADMDRSFQERMINELEALAEKGESSRTRFAYLYDRWAAGVKKPQRFGLQGHCTGVGTWTPNTLENPTKVDERRRWAGIGETLSSEIEENSRNCR